MNKSDKVILGQVIRRAELRDLDELADEDGAGRGELYAIYVDPQRWGDGTGVALEEAARAHLRDEHFTEATLWTLSANTRARRFYEKRGWRLDGSTKELMGATCVRYRTELRTAGRQAIRAN
jgi:GNAT superfamily N-acetyltransferase